MRVLERVRDGLNGAVVALTHCPLGARALGLLRRFIALFSPVSVLVWCIGLAVGLSGSFVLLALDAARPAVTITDVRETDGIVIQGGRINVLIEVDKVRECPTSTSRFLWRWVSDPLRPGEQVPLHIPLEGPPVPLTSVGVAQRSILSLPLPSDIAPGEGWFYGSKTIRDCGRVATLASHVVSETRPIPVRVLTAAEATDAPTQEGIVRRPDLRP